MKLYFYYLKKLATELLLAPVYFISFFFKRRRNVWVFGEWHGKRHSDNAKYFYEHVRDECGEVTAIWITKNKELLNKLPQEGVSAFHAFSLKGIYYCSIAKLAFVTHGADDINQYVIGSAILVNLTHGTPLKRIGKDALYDRLGALTYIFDVFLSRFLAAKKSSDYVITASEISKERFSTALNVKRNIVALGYPRWKPILSGFSYNDILKYKDAFDCVLLYAPTLRKNNHATIEPFDYGGIDCFISYIENKNILLLVRPHPSMSFSEKIFNTSNNVMLAGSDVFEDVNKILPSIDGLITDYSSVMYDFAILHRPIYLLAPDAEEYICKDVGIYGDYYSDALGPVLNSWDELIEPIENHRDKKTIMYDTKIVGHEFSYSSEKIFRYFREQYLD